MSWVSRRRAGIAEGDRDAVSDPDARVTCERQVGKRVDQEVVGSIERGTRLPVRSTSSLRKPAIMISASSSGPRSASSASETSEVSHRAGYRKRDPGQPAHAQSGRGGVSTSRSLRYRTSTPRLLSVSAKLSCSSCARSTQGSPSSRASLLRGVNRLSSLPDDAAAPYATGQPRSGPPAPSPPLLT